MGFIYMVLVELRLYIQMYQFAEQARLIEIDKTLNRYRYRHIYTDKPLKWHRQAINQYRYRHVDTDTQIRIQIQIHRYTDTDSDADTDTHTSTPYKRLHLWHTHGY